jgi:hypothetical protein
MAKKKKQKLKAFKFIPCVHPEKICGLELPDGGEILISYEASYQRTEQGEQLGVLTITSQTTDFDSLEVIKGRSQNSIKIKVGFNFE